MLSLSIAALLNAPQAGKPLPTQLVKKGSSYQLLRHGKPFFIKGAGVETAKLKELKAAGANTFRTWGVGDDTQAVLDEAQKLELNVVVGIWLRKVEDGFSYDKPADRESQYKHAQEAVTKFKNHPAVLMWAVGNEMELGAPDERVWQDVEKITKIFKQNDSRPVMTVVADMWPDKMKAILKNCPSLDMLGVNSYDGLPSLHERLKDWKKPYVITEFAWSRRGIPEKTSFGLINEPNSTEKAQSIEKNYKETILAFPGRVLGSFLFHWSRSTTQVSSLHGIYLKTGEKLEAVDTMTRLWKGTPPKNTAPRLNLAREMNTAQTQWELSATDPDGDRISWELVVIREQTESRFVGDFEKAQPIVFQSRIDNRFGIPKMETPGGYRAFAIGRDGKGGAVVWNHPFQSKAQNATD